MKYLTAILVIFIFGSNINAQTYEIGGWAGGSNYIGDMGSELYINPTKLVFGGIIKYNRSPRHSYRASLLLGQLYEQDSKASSTRRTERGYHFKNSIKEFALGMEYTFWEFDVHRGKRMATPYLYAGLAVFAYDALHKKGENDLEMKSYKENEISYAIPMAIGYKAKLSHHFMMGIELGVRYTFTDNIDGSNPDTPDSNGTIHTFGNPNSNDWYVFSGITFTFAFGRKPCNSVY